MTSLIALAVAVAVVGWHMFLRSQARWILTAAVLVVAFVAPSAALAHAGHTHHAPAVDAPIAFSIESQDLGAALTLSASEISMGTAAPVSIIPNVPENCGGHCCGGITGSACCSVIIAPSLFETPSVRSAPIVCGHQPPLHGLPPEALPRPPKSFA